MKSFKDLKVELVSIKEDGHTDVASAVRQCKIVIEDASQIMTKLQSMDSEESLPTWWSNKIAIASNSFNKMRDYLLVPSTESVNVKEDVVDQLRSIVKKKKESDITFKSGTSVPIDPNSAGTVLKTFDSLNSSNKRKTQDNMNKDTKSFMKVLDFAFNNKG
jgi:hypothetical protein|tara:strand:- start:5377 stop:5859 length:483 start_codon:yes stop_codon:yes gene_type:complete